MKITPRKDRVVVRKHKVETERPSGLIVSVVEKDEPNIGQIIAVGPEIEDLAVGQVVIFNHYSGNRVEYEGENYFVMGNDDVLALVEEA